MWHLLGPDSYAIERLLEPARGAYPDLSSTSRGAIIRGLRVSVPLVAALAVTGLVWGSTARLPQFLPAGASIAAAALVHTRTRYRFALLPALSVAATDGLWAIADDATELVALATFALVALLLLQVPARREEGDLPDIPVPAPGDDGRVTP
jgi:hypothetical protein